MARQRKDTNRCTRTRSSQRCPSTRNNRLAQGNRHSRRCFLSIPEPLHKVPQLNQRRYQQQCFSSKDTCSTILSYRQCHNSRNNRSKAVPPRTSFPATRNDSHSSTADTTSVQTPKQEGETCIKKRERYSCAHTARQIARLGTLLLPHLLRRACRARGSANKFCRNKIDVLFLLIQRKQEKA